MPLPPLIASAAILTAIGAFIGVLLVLEMRKAYERKLRQIQADHDLHIAMIQASFSRLNNGVNRVFYNGGPNPADVEEFLLRGLPTVLTSLHVTIEQKPPGLRIGDVTV